MRSSSASARSASSPCPQYRSLPAMITGRRASLSRAIARSNASQPASGPVVWQGSGTKSPSSAPTEKTMSSGKSRNAGPPCGVIAAPSAASISDGISDVRPGVAASFVSGATNGTWSISCREPWPQRVAGARPPRTSIGE